jgi:enterochelin esterase family protein
MILLLVGQTPQPGRNLELGNNAPFADYVATELLPHVRSKWHATSEPKQTALCGSSAGGLGSVYIAYRHPEVFGNVLSQSGAFWPGKTRDDPEHEWVIRQYESSPKLPIRFVLEAGVLEIVNTPLNGPSILSSNRHLRDVLQAKGYEVYYRETAGGHEPLNWRGGFAEGLIQLFGR